MLLFKSGAYQPSPSTSSRGWAHDVSKPKIYNSDLDALKQEGGFNLLYLQQK
jgi:hypothetical protein